MFHEEDRKKMKQFIFFFALTNVNKRYNSNRRKNRIGGRPDNTIDMFLYSKLSIIIDTITIYGSSKFTNIILFDFMHIKQFYIHSI